MPRTQVRSRWHLDGDNTACPRSAARAASAS